MKNKAITERDVDFAKWYTDIIRSAKLAEYSNVKGCVILEPNGYAIWENMQHILDKEFKRLGHQNVYMPLFIPESLLNKEKEHVEGFAPEVAWVTHGGSDELEERMCIRPTSETLFCDYYRNAISSYRDLPKLYNQWCNVVRWEKETRPFLRTREFLWQEGHTVHETAKEAEAETHQMLDVYKRFFEDYLAIPVVVGKKTEKEKFAGAEYSLTVEALMYNGVCLQSGTSHYFGQKFSKAFDITFTNRENKLEYPYQTSWGTTTRMIGGLIMVHSDDNGLVLPPKIAPIKVVIIPIKNEDKLLTEANKIADLLSIADIKTIVDNSDKSAGFKFAEQEVNGIPIRIEIGERELEQNKVVAVRRDNREKQEIILNDDIVSNINNIMETMQNDMFKRAEERNKTKTHICKSLDEVANIMKTTPGFIKAMWCEREECETKMKEIGGIKSRCIPLEQESVADKCIFCDKEANTLVVWGIQY